MKVAGALLFLTFGIFTDVSASVRCERLFEPSTQSKIVQKIESKVSIPYAKQFGYINSDADLSDSARIAGSQLIRLSRFFGTHQKDLYKREEKLSRIQILELADVLNSEAKKFANLTNLKYKLRRIDLLETSRELIVILPTGTHPLNVEAALLKKKYGTEVIYNPYDLVEMDAEAVYDSDRNQILISELILVNGSIAKNEAGRHELTHLRVKEMYDQKIPYLFHGFATATRGVLPGKRGGYDKDLYFEEVDAYFTSIQTSVNDLKNFTSNKSKYTPEQIVALDTFLKRNIQSSLQTAHLVSTRIFNIMAASLKDYSSVADAITFTKKDGYYIVKWMNRTDGDTFYYDVEIPLLAPENNLSREELLELTKIELQKIQRASAYFRNIYKVGLDINFSKKKSSIEEYTSAMKKYEKILKQKYIFKSFEDVPTQKELQKSLDLSF